VLVTNADDFARAMERRGKELGKDLESAAELAAQSFLAKLAQRMTTGPVQSRTGRLRDSFDYNVDRKGTNQKKQKLRLTIFSAGVPYANMREYGTAGLPGGVLRPRRAKFLTIPLRAAMTAVGVTRGSARMFTDAFFVNLGKAKAKPDMKQHGAIYLVRPAGAKLEWLFELRKEVRQEGGLGFFDLWEDEGQKQLILRLRKAVQKAAS
jgi:hypothetical protein